MSKVGRPKAQRCKRGHFTTEGGRYANGSCVTCTAQRNRTRDYAAEHKARLNRSADGPKLERIYIDAEPLRHWVSNGRGRLGARMLDRFISQRYRNGGKISLALVEDICEALAIHPVEVYGDDYWTAA